MKNKPDAANNEKEEKKEEKKPPKRGKTRLRPDKGFLIIISMKTRINLRNFFKLLV